MEIKKIQAKTILTPSKLPDVDYVINPYAGWQFGHSLELMIVMIV